MDGFEQYKNLKNQVEFHHGSATQLDPETRSITIRTHEGGVENLEYYALVIATGVRSPTPLTTLQGNYTISEEALDQMNRQLASAKEVVVSGGGPVGVETAGEIGTHLKGRAKITLIAGGEKILPVLSNGLASKAQKQLEKVGVTVIYNVKVTDSKQTLDGRTELTLDNGETMTADAYIPGTGVQPNTDFLPERLKGKKGYVQTNPQTLRVDAAGPRVYAAGDVASVDNGGVLNIYSSTPVMGANLCHDLLADTKLGSFAERKYERKNDKTQIVPVGAKTGVGSFNGFPMPGFAISMIKGKDYFLKTRDDIFQGERYPDAQGDYMLTLTGKKYVKA